MAWSTSPTCCFCSRVGARRHRRAPAFGGGLAFGDPDVGFGLLTWTVYAVALGARSRSPGFGPRAALVSVVAFVASSMAFLAFRSLGPATEFFL